MSNNLIFVTYDGILNSVFYGQVLKPLIKKLEENPDLKIYLISFEKDKIPNDFLEKQIPKLKNFKLIIFKRLPFLGKISLLPSAYQLKNFLNQFSEYSIIARGPLAGWIAIKSINTNLCTSLTIQARGLLAEEYAFAHPKSKNIFKNLWNNWRKNALENIEKEAFNSNNMYISNFCIEAVSTALKYYLINEFNANPNSIEIATYDIPAAISKQQCNDWRAEIREKLDIRLDLKVYCYNGSVKAWQYPEMVIEFFKKKLEEEKNVFLMILTQDIEQFQELLNLHNIGSRYCKILTVNHEEIYKYLSACDVGLIFRREHVVSWISRPVKAMEYQSCRLKIVHNNTVDWLIQQDQITNNQTSKN